MSDPGRCNAYIQLQNNKFAHDLIAPLYESRHPEIFNPTEQKRLTALLQYLAYAATSYGTLRVLDYGAGTGNLTRKLLNLGGNVVAADVSEGCLLELRRLVGKNNRLETLLIEDNDLYGVESERFDLVVTYSVLHHVPNYLRIVDEFVRITKPGGIICIDHEVCPDYWNDIPDYLKYLNALSKQVEKQSAFSFKDLYKIISHKNKLSYLLAAVYTKLKRNLDEGDIHVHKDDHIEWDLIRQHLEPSCEILKEQDYLLCREINDPPPAWSIWHDKCVDMRFMIARKK